MSDLRPGQLVSGVVTEHRDFGAFIEIGEDEPALALMTMLEDEPRSRTPEFPPIGSEVEAVFLGFSGPSRQPRLSLRPTDVLGASHEE
jgi:ribosomal protein S1